MAHKGTLVESAACNGDLQYIKDAITTEEDMGYALHWASFKGHVEICRVLLEHDPTLLSLVCDGNRNIGFDIIYGDELAIHRASNVEIVKMMVTLDPEIIHVRGYFGRLPIHNAVLWNWISVVSYYLKICPSLASEKDENGRTPLHYAISYNHLHTTFAFQA